MNQLQTVPAWPVTGNFLPDFELPSSDGGSAGPSNYRNRSNLVLVFTGDYRPGVPDALLQDLARHYSDVTFENAEVLAILRGSLSEAARAKQDYDLPYPVLADRDGAVHRAYAAAALDGRAACQAVYVAGRFGKVYLASRASDTPPLPTLHGVLGTLHFIEAQCPECGQDEF